jgi:Ca-activated chloride channel family protein
MKIYKYCLPFLFFVTVIHAQRGVINDGVDEYNKGKYVDAEVNFKKGKEKAPESFEAHFNLGDAYYKQGKLDESLKEFYSSLELTQDPSLKASAYHNIGNSLLKAKKIKESIEAYKNSLKINPNDQETKYNLSYALSLLDKQKNQQQNKQDNKNNQDDKDQQKNRDQNKNQDKDEQNKQNKQNQQNKPQDQQAKQDNLKTPQNQNQISKEEAERILQALKNNEKDIQKKLRKKTGAVVKREKDW